MEAGGCHLCVLPLPHFSLLAHNVQKGACTLLWQPDFSGCYPQDTTRSPGSGGQWGLCWRIPQDCNQRRRLLVQVPCAGHSKRQQTQEPSLSVKVACLLVLELCGLRDRLLWFGTHLGTYWSVLQTQRPVDAISALLLPHTRSPIATRKEQ